MALIDISQLDKAMALQHVALLTGDPDAAINLRFLHDAKEPDKWPFERRSTIAALWPKIEAFQRDGYGVFLIPNEGDADAPFMLASGREKKPMVSNRNITRIRAVFTDRDGKRQRRNFHLEPSFTLCRDDDHEHVYWLVDDLSVSEFRTVQKRLIAHYGTDRAICNPARVMRLGGTLNCKPGRQPMLYKLDQPGWPVVYNVKDILAGLPQLPRPTPSRNRGSDDPRVLHPETVELMFAHFDPTLSGERGTWYGAIKLLAEHGIALTREMEGEWWLRLAIDWSNGSLRRKHVNANFAIPETFKVRVQGNEDHDTEDEIEAIFNEVSVAGDKQ